MFCETERCPGWLNHGDRGAIWKALVRQLASGQIIKGFLWHVKGVIVYFIFLRAVEVIGTVSAGGQRDTQQGGQKEMSSER